MNPAVNSRPRGRPPKADRDRRPETVRGRVPLDVYDALCRRATAERKSLATVVGDALIAIFRSKTFPPEGDTS